MANNGIVGYNPETGKTAISYNGVRFYTKDKSVIAMAERGNVAGAAKRYAGKSSTARALRQANKEATKPIYKNVQESVFKKAFKGKKELNLGAGGKKSRQEFIKQYQKTAKATGDYIRDAVAENIAGLQDVIDKLPNELKNIVNNIIQEEVEKAYAAKGEVDDSDIESINDRITMELNDWLMLNPDASIEFKDAIADFTGTPISEIEGLERY